MHFEIRAPGAKSTCCGRLGRCYLQRWIWCLLFDHSWSHSFFCGEYYFPGDLAHSSALPTQVHSEVSVEEFRRSKSSFYKFSHLLAATGLISYTACSPVWHGPRWDGCPPFSIALLKPCQWWKFYYLHVWKTHFIVIPNGKILNIFYHIGKLIGDEMRRLSHVSWRFLVLPLILFFV